MKIYEYKTFNHHLNNEQLNVLGKCGWKLKSHSAAMNSRSFTQYYVFIRKIKQKI